MCALVAATVTLERQESWKWRPGDRTTFRNAKAAPDKGGGSSRSRTSLRTRGHPVARRPEFLLMCSRSSESDFGRNVSRRLRPRREQGPVLAGRGGVEPVTSHRPQGELDPGQRPARDARHPLREHLIVGAGTRQQVCADRSKVDDEDERKKPANVPAVAERALGVPAHELSGPSGSAAGAPRRRSTWPRAWAAR